MDSCPRYYQSLSLLGQAGCISIPTEEPPMEFDGQSFPVKPMPASFIKPGCRHRTVGRLKIINIPIPAFDEADEWFD